MSRARHRFQLSVVASHAYGCSTQGRPATAFARDVEGWIAGKQVSPNINHCNFEEYEEKMEHNLPHMREIHSEVEAEIEEALRPVIMKYGVIIHVRVDYEPEPGELYVAFGH
jgi:hypothetical protein